MESALLGMLKVYGPLSMGWVVAWLLWQRLSEVQKTQHADKIEDVKLKQLIATHLLAVKQALERLQDGS